MMQDTIKKESTFFTPQEISMLHKNHIPKHIAIIPDGNRRWAAQMQTTVENGHQCGADIIIDVVKAGKEIGVKALTFYTFSTENWLRPSEEIDAVMWLIEIYLLEQKNKMISEGIKFNVIGNITALPSSLQKTIELTKNATAHCNEIDLILAINYGGRDDITRAMQRMFLDYQSKCISTDSITEETISSYLDTAKWPDPELLIRTSGELRISNFLIWQISYSELHSLDIFWPDFRPHHLYQAIVNYQKRERRLGH